MKGRELQNMGIPKGKKVKLAMALLKKAAQGGMTKQEMREHLREVIDHPEWHKGHPYFGELAEALLDHKSDVFVERSEAAPWRQWGVDLEPDAIRQMENALRLPIAVAGALMPDAHVGYGLPIGGVLATEKAIVPYAVGMDIACRMRLTVFDMSPHVLGGQKKHLINIIEEETSFGVGATFKRNKRREHEVMDRDWNVTPFLRHLKDKAYAQLGTSGAGNHFVEFGTLTLEKDDLGLKAGVYLALLSHSGSRGVGAEVANYYSRLARRLHPELPRELMHLAWLDMDTQEGQDYWIAMNLMGDYAAANHELIHHHITKALKAKVLATVENHHNFCWKEIHDGREVFVHRKGATPADKGILGIIPGSMATPGYVVRGRGHPASLNSASHGAGRLMSRKQARSTLTWSELRRQLKEKGVTLISAVLEEAPHAYKDIEVVMREQRNLVDLVARFDPKIVKMAG